MSATAIREKDKEGHMTQGAAMWAAAAQVATGGIGGVGGTVTGVLVHPATLVYGTASNSSSMTIVTYVNEPAAKEEEYFKPHFAKHLEEMLAAPLDARAPEDEQKFIDWLNSD